MKMIIEENNKEGFEALLGKRVLILSAGYFYEGKLIGVNETCVKLSDPSVVFNVGEWGDSDYEDIKKMKQDFWYVSIGLIESFGLSKND
jgi:hypothetical protein